MSVVGGAPVVKFQRLGMGLADLGQVRSSRESYMHGGRRRLLVAQCSEWQAMHDVECSHGCGSVSDK